MSARLLQAIDSSPLPEAPPQPGHWLLTGANLAPRFGGISAVLGPLARATGAAGRVELAVAEFGAVEELPGLEPLPVDHFPLASGSWLPGSPSWRSLAHCIQASDGVHIHGIWQKHCAFTAHLARRAGKPYIISAHGMLDPWALRNKGWKKAAYGALVEHRNLRRAACLHALTSAEAEDYRKIAPGVPVAIIPNGVSVPDADPDAFFNAYPELCGRRLLLFLGRIHYKKGLDMLCRAWAEIECRWPETQLVLAGPDFENTRTRVEALAHSLGIGHRVTFTGMLAGPQKWGALAAASFFVLPSYSEGLSVSVLEALAAGVPTIVTRACHLPEVSTAAAGWVIEAEQEDLISALNEALAAPIPLARAMGERGRVLVARKYSWPVIGAQMDALYRWVLGGPKPSFVEVAP